MKSNFAWSASSFNYFVTAVLRQIASAEKKEILFETPISFDLDNNNVRSAHLFDAVAPKGLYDITDTIVFEFKYDLNEGKLRALLNSLYKKLFRKHSMGNITVIVITNTQINYELNKERNYFFSKYFNTLIWDYTTITKWIEQYPIDLSNALSINNPSKSKELIKDITSDDFTEKSRNNLTAVKRIIKAEDNFALVLGAGMSADPGAKSWNDLLIDFTNKLVKHGVINDSDKLNKTIGGSSIITAQLCKELFRNEIDYFWAIHNGLYNGRQPISMNFSLYHISNIAKLCANKTRFRILTYNYDDYLEFYLENMKVNYNTLFDFRCNVNSQLSIYHVHGFLPQVKFKSYIQNRHQKSIYLTEENYNELYNHPYSWQIASQLSFFRENICLFVGCSLTDPNIRRLLEMTKKENRTHYAILPDDMMTTNDLVKASNHFARLGIEIIWAKNYSDVSKKLELLY